MVFSGLDLVDDRLVVMAGNCRLEVDEEAVGARRDGAVVFGLATQRRDLLLQPCRDLLALACARSEQRAVTAAITWGSGECDFW